MVLKPTNQPIPPAHHPHRREAQGCRCGTAIAAEEELRSGERGGGDGRGEEGEECLIKAQSREGRQVGGEEVSAFIIFFVFIYLGGEERENKFPLRWRRTKSRPLGSCRHIHARLHTGRSRWHGDLIQLR